MSAVNKLQAEQMKLAPVAQRVFTNSGHPGTLTGTILIVKHPDSVSLSLDVFEDTKKGHLIDALLELIEAVAQHPGN